MRMQKGAIAKYCRWKTLTQKYMQDLQGLEPGSYEDDGGMYIEEQDIEQYDYTDDPEGQEGADDGEDDDAENDPQESDMQTDVVEADLQDEGDPSEQGIAEGEIAEGLDNDEEEAEAPADYPVSTVWLCCHFAALTNLQLCLLMHFQT